MIILHFIFKIGIIELKILNMCLTFHPLVLMGF